MATAFAILLAPSAPDTAAGFADFQEWLEERRGQIGTMMAAHEGLTEACGQLAE
jgi:hypothetical protein